MLSVVGFENFTDVSPCFVSQSKKDEDGEEVTTVFQGLNLKGEEKVIDDGGRVATGILVSELRARDIKISAFSLALHGMPLVEDTIIELNKGSRYGLLGRNGCGKSTFLKCLAAREVPIPDHFEVYLLCHEAPPEEVSALEYVIDSAKQEVARLDALIEHILVEEGPECPLLLDLYDKQDELDPATFETRASTILVGLGFKSSASDSEGGSTIHKQTK
jgi:ATP-binding cassette, subfamily F, member 2